ncbi:MAG: peptidyl-prolyl cis-trans isomerase [Candidatus Omnitrophica bacterium]|nr:peptidyl-prolyl cis-trans isomerase [Candidatus Omnitrophota bacterium]
MLKKLRNKKTRKNIWVILTTLIIFSFILWGSGGLIRYKREVGFVGEIYGKRIPVSEFKKAQDAVRNQLFIQFGNQLSEILKYINLEAETWDRLILLEEAKRRKIKVSDKEVIDLIQGYPFFKNKKGEFDIKEYRRYLFYGFHTPARVFEEQIRQNLMLYRLFHEVTKDVTITEQEVKEAYRKENEEIDFDYIASIPSDLQGNILVKEEELKEYYQNNQLEFKQPASFNLEYIALSKDDKELNLKLKRLKLGLSKKESLTNLTKGLNVELKETGSFYQQQEIPGIGWLPEVYKLLVKLKPGQYLPLINTDKFYYLFKIKEKKESHIADFDSVKEGIKEKIIREKARQKAKERIENCFKKLSEFKGNLEKIDLNQIAKEFGLKLDTKEKIKYGTYLEGIGSSNEFWEIARNLKEEQLSKVIELESGFYIIRLKRRNPISEEKFQVEKDRFSQYLLEKKKQQDYFKFLQELRKKAFSS